MFQSCFIDTQINCSIVNKCLTCEWICSGKSLIYRRNRIGPMTDPWGTADVTGIQDEVSPSSATHWVRPKREALIQFRVCKLRHAGAIHEVI